ncbi:DUF4174 domain-containing protein [Sediminicola arcticus]|jgi:hypothetical protein|uniref:DUF4174 domain-containing protein n=1 Tax=Sediminicola arcticus TaxID=1574308 RepID=A0ABV2SQQ0_9FLAO
MITNTKKLTDPYSKSSAIVLFTLMVMGLPLLQAQEPSSFKWKNRLLLILVKTLSEDVYIQQMAELNAHKKGLNDRKLMVYQIQPNRYTIGLSDHNWQQSRQLYERNKKTKTPYEIILVGLDGGNKLRKTTFLSCQELFDAIDAMPMRR